MLRAARCGAGVHLRTRHAEPAAQRQPSCSFAPCRVPRWCRPAACASPGAATAGVTPACYGAGPAAAQALWVPLLRVVWPASITYQPNALRHPHSRRRCHARAPSFASRNITSMPARTGTRAVLGPHSAATRRRGKPGSERQRQRRGLC